MSCCDLLYIHNFTKYNWVVVILMYIYIYNTVWLQFEPCLTALRWCGLKFCLERLGWLINWPRKSRGTPIFITTIFHLDSALVWTLAERLHLYWKCLSGCASTMQIRWRILFKLRSQYQSKSYAVSHWILRTKTHIIQPPNHRFKFSSSNFSLPSVYDTLMVLAY